MKNIIFNRNTSLIPFLGLIIMLFSACSSELMNDIVNAGPLELSPSDSAVTLTQLNYANKALGLSWTTGSNKGTGASISYLLQVDKKGNNLSSPINYEMGKGIYSKDFTAKELNDSILNRWGGTAGSPTKLEAKVVSTIYSTPASGETSPVIEFSITPYQSVSSALYMIGSATSAGWTISNAVEMTSLATAPWVFTYKGLLSKGSYKFAVSREGCWCQDFYTQDANDTTKMVHNIGGSGEDIQWSIKKGGNYQITVDLIHLTIAIEESAEPPFSKLWVVGDATPSGWDINTPKEMTRSTSNPFIFTYEAKLVPGDFKIFAGELGDWCGKWYRPLVDAQDLTITDVLQNSGCDNDTKWKITSDNTGWYKISLNTSNNKIKINPINLYLIGDATPNGWNINTPTPMTCNNGVYTFSGELKAGEMKFSKFQGDWCDDDWIISATPSQSISNTAFSIRHGCDGDDNKWKVLDSEAGNYTITIDLNTQLITITKQ